MTVISKRNDGAILGLYRIHLPKERDYRPGTASIGVLPWWRARNRAAGGRVGSGSRASCDVWLRSALCTLDRYIYPASGISTGRNRWQQGKFRRREFKARCLRIIKEMNRDGGSVTITNRGRPVAVLSPVPAPGEKLPPFIGMMRGTVLRYEEPFEPAARPSDWSALR